MTTEPGLNDRTAKLMMGHIHRIGMSINSLVNELEGTPAMTIEMRKSILEMELGLTKATQEIIALRDRKQTGGKG